VCRVLCFGRWRNGRSRLGGRAIHIGRGLLVRSWIKLLGTIFPRILGMRLTGNRFLSFRGTS
jgi:hypothetical protein